MHNSLLPLCAALSTVWIASLWQGAAIAAAMTLLVRAMPRLSAKLRYRLWMAAYLACVLLPVAEWLHSPTGGVSSGLMAGVVATHAPTFILASHWSLFAAWLWAASACFCFARLLAGLWAVRTLLRDAVAMPHADMLIALAGRRAGSRGRVRLLLSRRITAPVATGFLRPAIVLPHALLPELTAEQTAQVLRHELAHLARRDDWAALVTGCIGCVFPLQPALALLRRRLAETRELACDDAVLEAASPRAYAANLAHIASCRAQHRAPRLLPGLLGERSQLSLRIQHILTPRQQLEQSSRFLLAVAACGLVLLSGALVRCPSLITFETQSAPATLSAVIPRSPAAPAIAPRRTPATISVVHVVPRRHVSSYARHLLAQTHAPRLHSTPLSVAAEQPSAVLVVWTEQDCGFVTTLVLDLQTARSGNAHDRRSFSFLEI